MLILKFLMSGLIVLQFSGVIKSIVKSTTRVTKSAITPSGKIIKAGKDLNKASAMLLVEDAVPKGKSMILAEEKALAGQADDFAAFSKEAPKEGSTVGKGAKSIEKLEKELHKMTKEKVDESIEDLIFENLDRTGNLFENSVHELLKNPKFTVVSSYMKKKHDFTLRRKLDLFLLLNEREVDGFRIGRREVSRILTLHSDVFVGRALAFLMIDLSEYQPIIESLKRYAAKRNILLEQHEEYP